MTIEREIKILSLYRAGGAIVAARFGLVYTDPDHPGIVSEGAGLMPFPQPMDAGAGQDEIADAVDAMLLPQAGTLEAFHTEQIAVTSLLFSATIESVEVIVPTPDLVNIERNRRVAAGFTFGGKHFAFDMDSKARVIGSAALAGFAMGAGAQPGNLYWHGEPTPFVWIADDNSLLAMDAQTCFAFGQAAAAHEAAHIFAARAIKDATPIPMDFTNDQYWP